MINREILYERNVMGSYMKIPVNLSGEFDEKILLRKKIPGLLPLEKCFINGTAQYWYNISGKQSLDTFCRVKELEIDVIERLIVSICNQIEILEWNLLDTNCLMLDTELIFVSSDSREFIFMVYPGAKGNINKDFRQLMEFLITKVNHKDMDAVHAAYGIYEKTLDESVTLMDIRESIEGARAKEIQKQVKVNPVRQETQAVMRSMQTEEEHEEEKRGSFKEKLKRMIEERFAPLETVFRRVSSAEPFGRIPERKKEKPVKEHIQTVVYPGEQEATPKDYPTVLLSGGMDQPRGVLIYEGTDNLYNILIDKDILHIGKGHMVDVEIKKDTISHYHAKIEKENETYYIEDMNSKNGTFVNHELIAYKEKRQLKKNDIVNFADAQYRFC